MKSIFLSDSDEEAIVEFVKQHEELYGKLTQWTQHNRYGKLTQTKSGQAAEKSTKRQTWLKDSFSFL